MFCPKCGTAVKEGVEVCSNCGMDITAIDQASAPMVTSSSISVASSKDFTKKKGYSVVKLVYFGLAAVVLVIFFIAAINILSAGNNIMQIQSVGGRTLDEAYYHEVGSIYIAYAMISCAVGIFFASVIALIGLKY